jgi:dTDP-glucose 4,6-dehydratase
MKILITGGAGFIGSAVARRAITEGFSVVVVDALTHAGTLKNIEAVETDSRLAFEYADICDAEAMASVLARHHPDCVLHLAHADRSIDGPLGFVRTNVTGTAVLLEALRGYVEELPDMRRDRFKFHYVSSDEVFGTLGHDGVFDEMSPVNPGSPYSATKASADMLVRAWGQSFGLPVVISHASNNYGPFEHPEKLIPTVILNGLVGRAIPVYGRGLQVRDWLYVEDHAAALLEVLTRGRAGETYCIGGENQVTNLDVVGMVCKALDRVNPRAWAHAELIKFVEDSPAHEERYALSNAKITQTLGWKPEVGLEAGIARTVRWYLDNEDWVRARASRGKRPGPARADLKQAAVG